MAAFDFAIFKALGSRTRLRIMKQLRQGHMTLSDLSGTFGMKPASMKEQLDILAGAGLITREDNGRKWKYYSLTPAGAGIVDAGEVRVMLPALSGSILLWTSACGLLSGKVATDTHSLSENLNSIQPGIEEQMALQSSAPPGIAAEQAAPGLLIAAAGAILLLTSILLWLNLRKKDRGSKPLRNAQAKA